MSMGSSLKGVLLLQNLAVRLEKMSVRGVHSLSSVTTTRNLQAVPAMMSKDFQPTNLQSVMVENYSSALDSQTGSDRSIPPGLGLAGPDRSIPPGLRLAGPVKSDRSIPPGLGLAGPVKDNVSAIRCVDYLHKSRFMNKKSVINYHHTTTLDCLTANIAEIGDKVKPGNNKYDCPKIPGLNVEIDTPPTTKSRKPLEIPGTSTVERKSPGIEAPKKEAKLIMKIRHKKMKKHQLRKLRSRTWPIMRKVRFLRNRRKMRIFNANLDRLRGYGRDFDALEFIKENLEKAKLQGYSFDIFGPHTNSFGFADTKSKKDADLGSVLKKFSPK